MALVAMVGAPLRVNGKESSIGSSIDLKGATKKLNKTLVLKDGDFIVGPGKIVVEKGCEAIIIEGSNVRVKDVTFIAKGDYKNSSSIFKLTEKASDFSLEGSSFEGTRYTVLKADENSKKDKNLSFLKPVSGLKILKNVFKGKFSRHLYLHNIEDILIHGNTFRDCLRDSIRLRQAIKKVIISENNFKNIGEISKESSDAIDTYWSGEELIISKNIIDGCSTHGFDIKGISPDLDRGTGKVVVLGNIIRNCRFSGILVSSGAFVNGKTNLVSGFNIRDNIIEGCNINNKNPNDAAIFLRHGVSNANIIGNQIKGNKGHGIVLGNFEPRAIQTSSILISQNQISTDTKSHCVYSLAVESLIVTDNIMSGSAKKMEIKASYNEFKANDKEIRGNL